MIKFGKSNIIIIFAKLLYDIRLTYLNENEDEDEKFI